MEEGEVRLPIGSGPGVLLVEGIRNGAGGHAVLVREGDASRALLTAEAPETAGGRHRLVVIPLDEEVDLRVDGDALAIWLTELPPGRRTLPESVPAWANVAGLIVLITALGFALLGAMTFFAWLLRLATGS